MLVPSSQNINSLVCQLILPKNMDLKCQKTQTAYNIDITFTQNFCGGNCNPNIEIKLILQNNILSNPQFKMNVANSNDYKPLEMQFYYQNKLQLISKTKLKLEITPDLNISKLKNVIIQRTNGILKIQDAKMYFQF